MEETWPTPKNRTLRSLRIAVICSLGFVVVWAALLVSTLSGSDDSPETDADGMAVASGILVISVAMLAALVCAVIWLVERRRRPHAPAAWLADPSGAARLRWWDGRQWTEHTSAPPASTT